MSIRTTLTLDDDVLEALRSQSRRRGVPFRQAVNETLRLGLMASRTPPVARRLRIEPRHMGIRPGLPDEGTRTLLELGEREDYR